MNWSNSGIQWPESTGKYKGGQIYIDSFKYNEWEDDVCVFRIYLNIWMILIYLDIMNSGKDDVCVSTVDGKGRRTTVIMQSYVLNTLKLKVKKIPNI